MKKFLLFLTALLTLSVTAHSQNPGRIQVFVDGDWTYTINPNTEHEVTVVHYCGKEGSDATELTIPFYATYNGSRYLVQPWEIVFSLILIIKATMNILIGDSILHLPNSKKSLFQTP